MRQVVDQLESRGNQHECGWKKKRFWLTRKREICITSAVQGLASIGRQGRYPKYLT